MNNKYNSEKATVLLDLLIKERDMKLQDISREQVMDLDRKIYPKLKELIDILSDNSLTDAQMQYYFSEGLLRLPADIEELHLKRCENSGISDCTCLVTNDKPEVSVL